MPEKDTLFKSKMKHGGVFSFKDFYIFCYNWLKDETGLIITEKKYIEKIAGDKKIIEVKWECYRKLTDYFKFELEVKIKADPLFKATITQDGAQVETNKGTVEVEIKGVLVRDYQGKFEMSATQKFMRSIYEKWVVPSRIDQFEDKVTGDCDEFLGQAKAWLDLEGKR